MKPAHPTLETVAATLNAWRQQRRSVNEPVPLSLRQQVVALYPTYRKAQIFQTLKINHSTFKQWQQGTEDEVPHFVSLPPVSADSPGESTGLQVVWRLPQQGELHIRGLSVVELRTLIATFTAPQGDTI